LNLEDLSSKFDGLTDAHLKLNEAISQDLANRALQPDTIILEENLVDHFKEMERNIQGKIDAFSDEMSLDRFQREQEIRSLYRSPIGSPGGRPALIDMPGPPSGFGSPAELPGTPVSYDMASICNSLSSIAASLSGLSVSQQNRDQGTRINNETTTINNETTTFNNETMTKTLEEYTAARIAQIERIMTTTKHNSQISDTSDLSKSPQAQSIVYEWACDVLSGIDSAVVDGGCLYCGKAHFFEALDDSHLFGKHLVYDHSFGKCDLDSTFKTWSELVAHLRQFHRANIFALGELDPEAAERTFRRIKHQNEHHPHFHDVAESFPPEVTIREENPKLTDLILQAELICLLTNGGFLKDEQFVKAGIRSDLSRAIQKLGNSSFHQSDDAELMLSRSHQVACLEEELILSGYDLAIAPRRCREFFDIEQFLSRKRTDIDTARKVKSQFSKIWMTVDLPLPAKISSYIDHPFAAHYAIRCWKCRDWVAEPAWTAHRSQLCQSHKFGDIEADILLEEVPRGLRSSLVTMQFCRNNVQRISKWMQTCFLESSAVRVLLRTSNSTRSFFCGNNPDWVVPVLEFWDRDGLPANDLTKFAASERVIDGHDDLKGELSTADLQALPDEQISFSFNSSRQVWIHSAWQSQIARLDSV